MIEYILNGKTISVKPEHEKLFLKSNPSATRKTSWLKGEEGLVPDEFEFWKKNKPKMPGKSQEASQPQTNQQKTTESYSGVGSSESLEPYTINGKRIDVKQKDLAYFKKQNPNAVKYEKTLTEKATDTYNAWWNNTYVGAAILRGKVQASDTAEAGRLMQKVGSGELTMADVEAWVKANEDKAAQYKESARMLEFQKKYFANGSTWSAWYNAVKEDPAMLGELLIQSYSTMYHTFKESDKAKAETLAGAGAGFTAGKKVPFIGKYLGTVSGAMGALAAEMESSLAFGEFMQKELQDRNLELTDENIYNLLNSNEGQKIRNRAVARGAAIGFVEAMAGAGAGRATVKALQIGGKFTGTSRALAMGNKAVAGTVGVGVEALGGGAGEVAGRILAGQDMDPAEIGFEAVTGIASAPLTDGGSMVNVKAAKYEVNGSRVSYAQLENFVNTAEASEVASANISIKNDQTGIGKRVKKLQQKNFFETQVDSRVTGEDRSKLADLEIQRQEVKAKLKQTDSKSNQNLLNDINSQIDEITEKYKDVDIESAEVKAREQLKIEVKQNFLINKLSKTTKFAEQNASLVGKDLIMAESNVDAQSFHDMAVQEFNERIDAEIQNIQKSNLTVKQQNEAINKLNAKKISDQDVTNADAFVVGDVIVINKDIASSTGQINVGAHEVLHAVVAKHMQSLSVEERTNLISGFLGVLTAEQRKYIQDKINARNEKFNEGIDINSDEEVLNIFSDGITKGDITFNEGVFDKIKNFIQELLRKIGVKKEFENGRQVYNFLKDYQKSVDDNSLLSKRAQRFADGGVTITDSKFSKSVQQMSEAIDQHVPRNITTNEQYLARDPKTGLSPHDNVLIEILSKNTLDGYLSNLIIGDKSLGGVTDTQTLLEDTKFELIRKIRSEYKPTLEDGNFRSLFSYIYGKAEQKGLGGIAVRALGNMKKQYLQRPDASAAPLDVSTPEGKVTRQIADTETETSFDTQDLSIVKQAQESRQTKQQEQSLETEVQGKLVSKELKFTKETNDKINNELKKVNYDTNQPYENVKRDMMSQENPDSDVRSEVKPTGVLFKSFETIAKDVFGVDAKSTMARKQNLSKPENESARKVIADGAKKNKSIKKFLEDILPDTNFNPKSKKSLGTWSGLIRALYEPVLKDGKQIRYNNIVARKLNLDKFTEAEVADMFGLTPEYELLPWKKGFKDGMIKGVVVGAAGLSINQSIRKVADAPASPISIGKPETAFSRSVEDVISVDPDFKLPDRDKIDKILKNFINDTTYKHRTETEINEYFEAFETVILGNLPKKLFGKNPESVYSMMKKSNRVLPKKGVEIITLESGEQITIEKYFDRKRTELRDKIKAGKVKFGEKFTGPAENYQYGRSYGQMFGTTPAQIRKSETDGTAKRINEMHKSMHDQLWQRVNKSIRDNKQNAKVWGNYFSFVGQDTQHPHRMGAEYIGHSPKPKGTRNKKGVLKIYEWEHSMPATAAYLYLINASLKGTNFNTSYELVMKDYKLIALDNFDNVKLKDAGRETGMGKGWQLLSDSWLDRYFNTDVANIRGGIDPKTIIGLNGQTFEKIFGIDKFGRPNNVKYSSTPQQVKNSKNVVKAIDNRSKFSRSGKEVGMSIFDFDDTLGFTKSGVRATIPNPDNTPKPKRKVIFLAGGAGSGKGNVIRQLGLEGMGFKIVNSDISLEWLKKNSGLPADMRDLTPAQRSTLGKLGAQARKIARGKMMKYQGNANGVVVDGTGGSVKSMQKLVDEFKSKGYDVSMLFVDTSLDVALERNRARKERSLLDTIVTRNHEAVQGNKSQFETMFKERFMEVNTDNLTMNSAMPTQLIEKMQDFVNSYEKVRLDAAEFAEQGDAILEQGGTFDFSEFNNVVDGTPGPLLNKARQRIDKFGNKDVFVLTARPQASEKAIHEFLKSQGVNIPIENITGLANSSGDAKASWVLEKFAEGYNNIYFADDAIQNVEAVKKVLDQLDVKSDVVQAKTKFSKTASQNFNTILEESEGTSRNRTFSYQEAKRMGKNKGWWRILVPPSAEDFKGLLYRFLGKGRQGEMHMKYFKLKLLDPFAKGIRAWNIYKQEMVNEYKQLKKRIPGVVESLNKKVPRTNFTVQDAIRVYLWEKAGFDIPGIDENTKVRLSNYVLNDANTRAFADILGNISKVKEGYVKPDNSWALGTISTDLNNAVNKIGRKQFLQEYLDNVEAIFTPENMNKIEALYGTNFRDALENILYRMENGGNRRVSTDKNVNRMYNWINGSIGAIMFFNMRSALLQTISTVNFINWSDNNIFKASAAFANQPQFWSDFAMLFNSPQLKQRRSGIQIDVSASELSRAFADGKGTAQDVISWLLEKGFTPTQIADSFAISFGGASFYRNRFNKLKKQGMTDAQAKEQAMLDFQEIAESTQQSSREDLISMQQAGPLGRLILAFQNVTMQYTRLTKKAVSDLVNGRGDVKTNISKIMYYGFVQNLIFGALQSALFFIMWGDDKDEKEIDKKTERVLNGALDSLLRGTGIYGAIIATIKNSIMEARKQSKKGWGRDDTRTILEIVNLSPPIGSKLRKIYNAILTEKYNKGVAEELGPRIENPDIYKWASIIEALTNIPTQRLIKKANNIEEAVTGNHEMWQRIMLALGWNKWDVGVKDEELEAAKKRAKDKRKKEKDKDKPPRARCTAIKKSGGRCKNTTKNKNKRCYAHQ